jgi:hypothetical protein
MDGAPEGWWAGEHSTAKNVAGKQAKFANDSANFIFDLLVILPMVGADSAGYSPAIGRVHRSVDRYFEAMLSG